MRNIFSNCVKVLSGGLIGLLTLMSAASASATNSTFDWPTIKPVPILKPFEAPLTQWSAGHRGVDLALAPGQPVYAAGDGKVCFAGKVAEKPVVSICHQGNLRTTYEPVTPTVSGHQAVVKGQQIGLLASYPPPYPANPGLHWGAKRGDVYLNPLSLLRGRIVLKPWDG